MGKNKKVLGVSRLSLVLGHWCAHPRENNVICDLLLNRRTEKWNLFVAENPLKKKRKNRRRKKNFPRIATTRLLEDLCQFRYFPSHKRYVSSLLFRFFFILLVDSLSRAGRVLRPSLAQRTRIIVQTFSKLRVSHDATVVKISSTRLKSPRTFLCWFFRVSYM